jgi:uncharacterized membrane protein YhaH (DUF805 family)
MSSFVTPQTTFAKFDARSLGAKFFVVLFLALAMSLSGFLVEGLTAERADNHGVLAASADGAAVQPQTVLGIRLADTYRSTRRSLHYIALFLGLVFLTYFLFETMTGRRVHPAQYALVGIAQTIFYLLLLSMAEHLEFFDCGRGDGGIVFAQHGVGVSQPGACGQGVWSLYAAVCVHLCAAEGRGVCAAGGGACQLFSDCSGDVHDPGCGLVWRRGTRCRGCSAAAERGNAGVVAEVGRA